MTGVKIGVLLAEGHFDHLKPSVEDGEIWREQAQLERRQAGSF